MTTPAGAARAVPGQAWLVWGVGLLVYGLAVTSRTSLSAAGIEASDRFGVSAGTLSLFAVLQLAVYGALQVPVGVLLDRFGTRRVLLVGVVTMAVGQVVLATATAVPAAIAARALVGAGDATVFVAVLRLVVAWFPVHRTALMVQVTGIVGQLGQVVSVVPLRAVLDEAGWEPAFLGLGAALALGALLVALAVREGPRSVAAAAATDPGGHVRGRLAAAWSHPGTRLGLWTHAVAPFPAHTFALLWGFPYLTAGEGLTDGAAQGLLVLFVLAGIVAGLLIGRFTGRHPLRRSWAVLAVVAVQAAAWTTVLLRPGPAPSWLLVVLVLALASGGPGSLVGLDYARSFNPPERISSAQGIVNSGGFVSALVALALVGVALDLQGAGTPDTYTLDAFRWAMAVQYPMWAVGVVALLRARRRTRALLAEQGTVVPPLRQALRRGRG
ncbi:MFS transporter [Cellulomonas marina]|uniref:Sugar phosphate permease n=1 Tax=Cellulomonas marina TaxID=988821 RepID=A0A1I0WKU0_9CELL|nr:MFS transporter [Cellulomonas marina]GIG27717.1 MFS transporter [Cellulomonas marina]SFA89241.1 Sugar phosphate permease [Cellulomonas marina]